MAAASLLEIPKNRGSKRSWNFIFAWNFARQFHRNFRNTKKQKRLQVLCLCLFGVFFYFFFKFHEFLEWFHQFLLRFWYWTIYYLQWARLRYTRVCSNVLICHDACEFVCFNKRRKIYVKHCKPLNVNCSESPLCFGTQIEVVTITRMSQQVSKRFATIFGLITWLVFYPSTSQYTNSEKIIGQTHQEWFLDYNVTKPNHNLWSAVNCGAKLLSKTNISQQKLKWLVSVLTSSFGSTHFFLHQGSTPSIKLACRA